MKALITNESGQILVVNERGKGWDLPGGGLDWGEDTIAALHREIAEELGCKAEIDKRPLMIVPANNNDYNQHVLWIIHKVVVDLDLIHPTEDVQEIRFMSVTEFQAYDTEFSEGLWKCPIDFWHELQMSIAR